MRNQIASSIEQSRRLLSCGVDPKTADLVWTQRTHRIDGSPIKKNHQKANLWIGYPCKRFMEDDEQRIDIPAWSLSRMLELLPQSIMSQYGNEYFFELSRLRMHDQWEAQWVIHGERFKTVDKADKSFCKLWDKSPIEACVKAIEWVVKNGYSLNKIEE